jgi:hypothetical protein
VAEKLSYAQSSMLCRLYEGWSGGGITNRTASALERLGYVEWVKRPDTMFMGDWKILPAGVDWLKAHRPWMFKEKANG